jgi:hypothetical protein
LAAALLAAVCRGEQRVTDPGESSVADLLGQYASILRALRERGVVRSANAPAGDYAEWLFAKALGGTLVDNFSVKSYDLTLVDGVRVQVKTRVISDPPRRGQLQTSPFRSWDFHLAGLLLLRDTDYAVLRAALVPVAVVEAQSTFRPHVNGAVVQMNDALLGHPEARDVTADLRRAAIEG